MRKISHATSFIGEAVLSPGLILGLMLAGVSSSASAIRTTVIVGERPYLFESIDTPLPSAATVKEVSGINNNGVMVGTFDTGTNEVGFVLGPGIPFTEIQYGSFDRHLKINDFNQVVGDSTRGPFQTTVPNGSFAPIIVPSELYFLRTGGISNQGVTVGQVSLPGAPFESKGFEQGGGLQFTLFSPGNSPVTVFPNTKNVEPHSIALSAPLPSTLIVGNVHYSGGDAAFLAQGNPNSDTAYTNISADLNLALQELKPGHSEANGVNGFGIVVGSFLSAPEYNEFHSRGFMDEANSFSIIDAPNSQSTSVFDINDKGQIVGGFRDQQERQHGFLMTPLNSPLAGLSPANPLMPTTTTPDVLTFQNPSPGLWFDPGSVANGFTYSLTGGGTFIEVAPPLDSSGFGPVEVVVGGSIVGTLHPGENFFFEPGVTTFSLMGISPGGNHTAFPTFLNFTGGTASLTVSTVPEPSSWVLLSMGLVGLFGYCWRAKGEGSVSRA